MAKKLTNIANLFRDARARTIIVITGVLFIFAVSIGWISFHIRGKAEEGGVAQVGQAPSISAIPGSISPTERYAKLQEAQNIQQAQQAKLTGGSAIPTVVRLFPVDKKKPLLVDASKIGAPFTVLAQRAREGGVVKGVWFDDLRKNKCSQEALKSALEQGATPDLLREAGCTAVQLKQAGFKLAELKQSGYDAAALRKAGFTASQLVAAGFNAKQLRDAGFSACEMKNAGFTAKALKEAGYSDAELRGAGFTPAEIHLAGGLQPGMTAEQIHKAGCSLAALKKQRSLGVSAAVLHDSAGCSASALLAAGYTPAELRKAGFTAQQLRDAGVGLSDLRTAGFSAKELRGVGFTPAELKKAGYSLSALKAAGYSAADLKQAGYGVRQLQAAGYTLSDLKEAGFTAADLKNAGYSLGQLKGANFSARELKAAGFPLTALSAAGFSAKQLKDAGFSAAKLQQAGYNAAQLRAAGFTPSDIEAAGISPIDTDMGGVTSPELQQILRQQAAQLSAQRLETEIQERQSNINSAANRVLGSWRAVSIQQYIAGSPPQKDKGAAAGRAGGRFGELGAAGKKVKDAMIKAGDIQFAVLDTSVNSDEPGPILATIVTGKFKGAKLIGSLQLPGNATKVILTFNVMSLPTVGHTISISSVAIDPNTARTAISSRTDSHFLLRWGSLFASSFMEGLGQAVSREGTSVKQGANNGSNEFKVDKKSSGDRMLSALDKIGQTWGGIVSQNFSRPPTVHVFSGTSVGILFTQDVPPIS